MIAGAGSAQIDLGLFNARKGRFEKAADCFRKATSLDPGSAQAHQLLGVALLELGRWGEAIEALDNARSIDSALPNVAAPLTAALKALGEKCRDAGQITQAAALFERAVELAPDDVDAHLRLGVTLIRLSRQSDAVRPLDRATALAPGSAAAWYNLGITLAALKRPPEALAAFQQALAVDPGHALARAQLPFIHAQHCDWEAIDRDSGDVAAMGIEGPLLPPFAMLPFEDHPPRHRQRSERFVAAIDLPDSPVPPPPTARPKQLRVGYFSADFCNHATMHLARRLFELHDRARFVVEGFSLGPPDDDEIRRQVERTFDLFTDVDRLDDPAVAALARDRGIDIAIDMMGYTEGSRPGIFAHRAAPIQMSFLGFPGTSGAPFIDYLIADPIVVPQAERAAYSESLLRLPHSYQINDDQRAISSFPMSRADAGLPVDGFVFCCFNNINKIKPPEFAIWMRLLDEVAGSVLWLHAGSETSRANLRDAARRHGVDPGRLVFASPVPLSTHLARHRLADLFLDTFHYNAHTTASDALWAGLPLVTKAGRGFAARVAASLLHAVGLDELVTDNDADYYALARDLALDPARLASIRRKLADNRLTMPLFDTNLFVRHIEAGYDTAYRRYLDGLPPADIDVAP